MENVDRSFSTGNRSESVPMLKSSQIESGRKN